MELPITPTVTEHDIADGLHALGLDQGSAVIVHASLRSFGYVEGAALAVCKALVAVCGTLLMPAASWDLTGIPAPPGLVRPYNAVSVAASWPEFDAALAQAVPWTADLPIDRELGWIPETMRQAFGHRRGCHPLLSYLAVGKHADELIATQRLDHCLGPIEALAALGGDVLQLGVTHTTNTAIHLAEQHLGRSCFYRYAKVGDGVWIELPNIPGQSHRFDDLQPMLAHATREVMIGACRARRIGIADVLAAATQAIEADPAALLCDDRECRCFAAFQQRLAWLAAHDWDAATLDPSASDQ